MTYMSTFILILPMIFMPHIIGIAIYKSPNLQDIITEAHNFMFKNVV